MFKFNSPRLLLVPVGFLFGLSIVGCEPPEPIEIVQPLVADRPQVEVFWDDELLSWDARIAGSVSQGVCQIGLYSSLDGFVWSGLSDEYGEWVFRGQLSPGETDFALRVRCDGMATMTLRKTVFVRENASPECRIASPLDGQVYRTGAQIAFVGDNWDPDDDELLELWASSLDGGLIEGEEWAMSIHTPGAHDIHLNVIDEFGASCSDTVTIYLE